MIQSPPPIQIIPQPKINDGTFPTLAACACTLKVKKTVIFTDIVSRIDNKCNRVYPSSSLLWLAYLQPLHLAPSMLHLKLKAVLCLASQMIMKCRAVQR
eukprot:13590159-Ditylum_brightwellii.AAC.1